MKIQMLQSEYRERQKRWMKEFSNSNAITRPGAPSTSTAKDISSMQSRLASLMHKVSRDQSSEDSAQVENLLSAELTDFGSSGAVSLGVPGFVGYQAAEVISTDAIMGEFVGAPDSNTSAPANANEVAATVTIPAWKPNAPYLELLWASATPAAAYSVYLQQRVHFGRSPAFYLDCAHWFFDHEELRYGLRILTTVLELRLDEPGLLRLVAYKLLEQRQYILACDLLEQVRQLRPEEPQSHRDLALARLEIPGPEDQIVELLEQVLFGTWDQRFNGIEMTVLADLHSALMRLQREGRSVPTSSLPPDLLVPLDADLRVLLCWDADQTDVDLWVLEPNHEKCFYGKKRTDLGGFFHQDFRNGYGPEEYWCRRQAPGKYTIQANFFGNLGRQLTGPVTLYATIVTDYARPTEKRRLVTKRLDQIHEVIELATTER